MMSGKTGLAGHRCQMLRRSPKVFPMEPNATILAFARKVENRLSKSSIY